MCQIYFTFLFLLGACFKITYHVNQHRCLSQTLLLFLKQNIYLSVGLIKEDRQFKMNDDYPTWVKKGNTSALNEECSRYLLTVLRYIYFIVKAGGCFTVLVVNTLNCKISIFTWEYICTHADISVSSIN